MLALLNHEGLPLLLEPGLLALEGLPLALDLVQLLLLPLLNLLQLGGLPLLELLELPGDASQLLLVLPVEVGDLVFLELKALDFDLELGDLGVELLLLLTGALKRVLVFGILEVFCDAFLLKHLELGYAISLRQQVLGVFLVPRLLG